jgi:hypothetical protein
MAQQDVKLYLVGWHSLLSGEVDFTDKVLASSPEDAMEIASEGCGEEFLNMYWPEAEEM